MCNMDLHNMDLQPCVRMVSWQVSLRRGAKRLACFVVRIPQNGRSYEVSGELLRTGRGGLYTRPVIDMETTTLAGLQLPVSVRWPCEVESRIDDLARSFWYAGGPR